MSIKYFRWITVALGLIVFFIPILIGSDGSAWSVSFQLELAQFFKNSPGINTISSGSKISNALAIGIGTALVIGLTMGCISFFVDGDMVAAKEKIKHLSATQKVLFPLMLLMTVVMPWFLEIKVPEPHQLSHSFFVMIRSNIFAASFFCVAIFIFSIASITVFRIIKK